MKRLSGVRIELAETRDLIGVAARELGLSRGQIQRVELVKRSIDARHRRPRWVCTLDVYREGDPIGAVRPYPKDHPAPEIRNRNKRVVIAGTGPAGLFAALRFADAGVPCTVVDRGSALERRHQRAKLLRSARQLDPESNLCFGEGGAGTYSDGKLYTRKKDKRVREVYERLVAFGGDPAILVDAHPHLGTNRLIPLLRSLRAHLESRGITILFDTRLDDLVIQDGRLRAVVTAKGEELQCDALILATGHSARDTYTRLAARGVPMESKPFAIGARVEHPQALIDAIQFGAAAGHPALGAAEYFLRCRVGDRGVYSFCMCPGGFIIPTPTEPGHLNVNGMSNQARGNHFANAALVVTVEPRDFAPSGDPLEGIAFQRRLEKRAFDIGGSDYSAPATRLTDLVRGRSSDTLPQRTSYRPALTATDIGEVLPDFAHQAIRQAVEVFERKMRGYLTEEAVIVAVETTTSSPIRLTRGADLQSPGIAGLYPTGEGAGYAGGIVSSALDGLRVAEHVLGSA